MEAMLKRKGPQKIVIKAKRRLKRTPSIVVFDENRAQPFFTTLAEAWRTRSGIYAYLIPPQQAFMPECFRGKELEMACYFFFQALTMRGGINSDDAFNINRGLAYHHPEFFDPQYVSKISAETLIEGFKAAASELQLVTEAETSTKAGTLSYKLNEHAQHWIHNAKILCEYFHGDPRDLYGDARDSFEPAYKRLRPMIKGMQRKIFALLTMWLQEFNLIHEFPLPIVVDFHCLRLLFQHEIISTETIILDEGDTEDVHRKRPKELWGLTAVKSRPSLVTTVMKWSETFLQQCGLASYDVSHALWFLSRELCKNYLGNKSFTKKSDDGDTRGRTLTNRLYSDRDLENAGTWPLGYRDSCQFCPVEATCENAFRPVLITIGECLFLLALTLRIPAEDLHFMSYFESPLQCVLRAPETA
jgi:hypothetical protein